MTIPQVQSVVVEIEDTSICGRRRYEGRTYVWYAISSNRGPACSATPLLPKSNNLFAVLIEQEILRRQNAHIRGPHPRAMTLDFPGRPESWITLVGLKDLCHL